jgi:hypothetical protein
MVNYDENKYCEKTLAMCSFSCCKCFLIKKKMNLLENRIFFYYVLLRGPEE